MVLQSRSVRCECLAASEVGCSETQHGAPMNEQLAKSPPVDFPLDHVHRWGKFCSMIGVDRSTVYRWVQKGIGPKVTKLGPGSSGVRHRDYLAWLEARNPAEAA